jgi:hypothetical protein
MICCELPQKNKELYCYSYTSQFKEMLTQQRMLLNIHNNQGEITPPPLLLTYLPVSRSLDMISHAFYFSKDKFTLMPISSSIMPWAQLATSTSDGIPVCLRI